MMRTRSIPYKWLVATAFVSALFMDLMDQTVVNVALPKLGRDFHAGNTTLVWVVTGYLLSLAVWIPASGWLGDRIGTKKVFLFALAVFTAGSALCGLSQGINQLIAFRILQGVGGGMLTPVGVTMLFRAFPPEERARASTVLVVPTVIAPALGPILGGWLVTDVTWRAIFYINLPTGILGFLFAAIFLREHREESAGRFDVWGFLLSGLGLALILYALSRGPDDGWGARNVLGTLLGGAVLFALLVVVELRASQPMLELRLFADRMFRSANLAFFMLIASLLGNFLLLPLFLQQLRGYSALETGWVIVPFSIGTVLISQPVGKLYPRVGPRYLIALGLLGGAATSALFLAVDLNTGLWWLRGIMFLSGLTFGVAIIPVQAATYATISERDTGNASSLFNTNRQVASSLGVAAVITVLTTLSKSNIASALRHAAPAARQAATQHAVLHAYHDAFFAVVLIAAVGVFVALLIHNEDAAATMRPVAVEALESAAVEPLEPAAAD
jgi:EmrB/QacA subfamily drug resistance transporter